MPKLRYYLFVAFFCFVAGAVADEEAAIVVLHKLDLTNATDAELFEASSACRQLTRTGSEKAVDSLERLLDDSRTTDYARTALKNIGGEKAEAALKKHPTEKNNASPVDGKRLNILSASLPIIAKKDEAGVAEFAKLLKSDDRTEFAVALETFRKFPDEKLADMIIKEQAALKPERRAAAILSLSDLNESWQVPPPIVDVATSDPTPDARAAALTVLGKFAEPKTIPILFNALGAKNRTVADAAFESLARTKSSVENFVVQYLENDDPNIREAACRIIGERRILSAQDTLWDAVSLRSCKDYYTVLGRIADEKGFERLLDSLTTPETMDATKAGLLVACQLAADPKRYYQILNRNPQIRPVNIQLELLEALGSEEALKSIAEIAATTDKDDVRDKATQILGEWTGAEVAPVLLDLSGSLEGQKYKIRAMRGFLRAIRQFDMPKEEKRKLCERALDIAQRDEEKKLIREQLDRNR